MITFVANASVIDIVEQADGKFNIFSDGTSYGSGMSRDAAEKVARKLGGSNTINWKWFTKTTPTPGAGATAATYNPLKALPAHQEPAAKPAPKPATPKVNVAGVALGAVGVVTGAIGLSDSVKSKQEKTNLGDVGTGAMSGMSFAAGTAAIVNAIPVGGQIAYGAAVAVGTVIGASGATAKMFAETDCDMDPVTNQYACCNVSKLTNIQARLCNIGDEMFAEFPYVRTCMQGKNKYESDWVAARFLDDHWSDTGEVKFCAGYSMPENGNYKIQAYGSSDAPGKVCWQWECADSEFVRSGSKCVPVNESGNGNQIDTGGIKAGDACPPDRLPQYATAGVYIKNGKNPDTGLDKFVCAATNCKDGTYLVKNERGESQGWCRAG